MFEEFEAKAIKYTMKNVKQCWECQNKGSDAVFKGENKNGILTAFRLPECTKYGCFITELDGKCPDFCKKSVGK